MLLLLWLFKSVAAEAAPTESKSIAHKVRSYEKQQQRHRD